MVGTIVFHMLANGLPLNITAVGYCVVTLFPQQRDMMKVGG